MLVGIKKFGMIFLLVMFGQTLCSDPRPAGGGADGKVLELAKTDSVDLVGGDDSSDDELRLQRLNLPSDVIERLTNGTATKQDLVLVAGIKVDEMVMQPLLAAEEARKAEIAAYLAARKTLEDSDNPEFSDDVAAECGSYT